MIWKNPTVLGGLTIQRLELTKVAGEIRYPIKLVTYGQKEGGEHQKTGEDRVVILTFQKVGMNRERQPKGPAATVGRYESMRLLEKSKVAPISTKHQEGGIEGVSSPEVKNLEILGEYFATLAKKIAIN